MTQYTITKLLTKGVGLFVGVSKVTSATVGTEVELCVEGFLGCNGVMKILAKNCKLLFL